MKKLNRLAIKTFSALACLGLVGQPVLARETQTISITDISDLKPSDWAYQAIVNLADRYGCTTIFQRYLADPWKSGLPGEICE